MTDNAHRTKMPVVDLTLKFTNGQKQLNVLIAAYANFECILQRQQRGDGADVDTHHTYVKKDSRNSNKNMSHVASRLRLHPLIPTTILK